MIEEAKVRLNPKPNQNSYHPGFAAEYSVLTNVYLSPFTTTSLDVNFFLTTQIPFLCCISNLFGEAV